MKLYFVRHGRSADHETNKRQRPDSILGYTGKKQARLVAKRFKKFNEKVDCILTSPWPRAFETAKKIGKELGQEVEINEDIYEKEQEASVYGLPVDGKEFERYISEIRRHGSDLDWKYKGGGESLRDVIKRAAKLQRHLLKEHHGETLIIVSHGNFMRCFVAFSVLGKNYDDKSFYKLFDALHFENTGISFIAYDEGREKWNLVYVNDHSHLGSDSL